METVFRLFMYLFPYALSIVAYVWVFGKALRVPHKVFKAIALVLIVAGFGYTLYQIAVTVRTALTDDRFQFAIIVITVFVLFFASIAIALGEPDEKKQ